MADMFTIRTNLIRAVVLGAVAVLAMFIFYLANSNIGTLLILILVMGFFLQYIFSKKIYRIVIDKQKIMFEYLQLKKRTVIYERELLYIKKRDEVHFRGGKNKIFEIRNKNDDKKIFEISKRSFKSEIDYKTFTDLFKI